MKLPFGLEIVKTRTNGGEKQTTFSSAVRKTQQPVWMNQFDKYNPLMFNMGLYDIIREVVPILDVAVEKIARMIGGFELKSDDKRTQEFLDEFYKKVQVNTYSRGMMTWLYQHYDSTIAKGFSVGEIMADKEKTKVFKLVNKRPNGYCFVKNDNGEEVIAELDDLGRPFEVEESESLTYLAFDIREGSPLGYSLFWSLPSVVKILLRIQQSIDNTIYRMGDPTGVGILTAGDATDYGQLKSAATEYADELTEVNIDRKKGKVRDIVFAAPPGGGMELKTLFADARLPNMEFYLRAMMEQILSKTNLPAYYFGLYKWSDRETMTKDQSDALIANINFKRSMVDPIIERAVGSALLYAGLGGKKYWHEWDAINLKDEKSEADTRFVTAQAQEKEIANLIAIQMAGIENMDAIVDYAIENNLLTGQQIRGDGSRELIYSRMREIESTYRAVRLAKILEET